MQPTQDADWVLNPMSGRLVLKDGPTYTKLVKLGYVKDVEYTEKLKQQEEEKKKNILKVRKTAVEKKSAVAAEPVVPADKVEPETDTTVPVTTSVSTSPKRAPKPKQPKSDKQLKNKEIRELAKSTYEENRVMLDSLPRGQMQIVLKSLIDAKLKDSTAVATAAVAPPAEPVDVVLQTKKFPAMKVLPPIAG